jgi:hypothetical protein
MGKRSSFERAPRDFYRTPAEAVAPLLPFLPPRTRFIEPCAGDGALVRHLEAAGHVCVRASDIEPQGPGIERRDALAGPLPMGPSPVCFITNPPWRRDVLHPLIAKLVMFAPTWLLFDADWMHTKQAGPYMRYLAGIVSVGRVKWIPDSKMTGKDNCCWYLFNGQTNGYAQFIGRQGVQPERVLREVAAA